MESEKKRNTNDLICRTETEQTHRLRNLWLLKGTGWVLGKGELRIKDWHIHTEVYGMTGQWVPAV